MGRRLEEVGGSLEESWGSFERVLRKVEGNLQKVDGFDRKMVGFEKVIKWIDTTLLVQIKSDQKKPKIFIFNQIVSTVIVNSIKNRQREWREVGSYEIII